MQMKTKMAMKIRRQKTQRIPKKMQQQKQRQKTEMKQIKTKRPKIMRIKMKTQKMDQKLKRIQKKQRKKTKKKKELLVKNQFNFSDRASQTFNEPLRDREIQTEPAPKSVFSQNANPFSIRDEYLNNLLKLKQQQLEEENKKKAKSAFGGGTSSENKDEDGEDDNNDNHKKHKIKHNDEGDALLHSAQMLKALKIMERVTVLNANSDSYHDFRYYKPSDYKRGSFVNKLWTFNHNDGKDQQRMVTCLEWNKLHLDLFAVGYGSYNFNFQTSGMICIYSLKSTVYPEKIILCESGVMSMSFHPKYSSLLCVGHYDGSVAVYDIRNRDDSPIYSSQNPESHHSDPVWDIKWYNDELQHELMFYSISSDSEIKFWKMSQNELNHEVLIKLTTPPITITQSMEPITTEDPNKGKNKNEDNDKDDNRDEKALCSCFDFNPKMEHLYLVGTEDGHIMECNKTYNDGYTKIYVNAHYMNVYCIKWNPFHDKIFLSCSEDWTIKLWEIDNSTKNDKDKLKFDAEPIITYDLGNSINDIAWSPYSSTIFAAVTSDGKVHLFDLSQNKNSPLCSTTIVANDNNDNCKLTKVAFPIGFPLIIVGDEKGNVYALKLSPNLYLDKVKHRDILKQGISPEMFSNNIDFKNKEKDKLINVLNVTGNKVFDIIQHFSPQKKPIKKK